MSDILLLLPRTVTQKVHVSQVSRYWRNVALHTPLLWSRVRVEISSEGFQLPLVLSRARDMPLEVDLDLSWPNLGCMTAAANKKKKNNEGPAAAAVRALVRHATRIRVLAARFGAHVDVDVAPLLDAGREFPALEVLRMRGPEHGPGVQIALAAPRLRELRLDRVDPRNIVGLFVPSLERVSLVRCWDANVWVLQEILRRCPALRELALHTWDTWPTCNFAGFADLAGRSLATGLRILDLRLPEEDMIRVLEHDFARGQLGEIHGSVFHTGSKQPIDRLVRPFLRDLGPLVSLEVHNESSFTVRDAAGLARHISIWDDDSNAGATFRYCEVWRFLAEECDARNTLRRLHATAAVQDAMAKCYAECPLPPNCVVITSTPDMARRCGSLPENIPNDGYPGTPTTTA